MPDSEPEAAFTPDVGGPPRGIRPGAVVRGQFHKWGGGEHWGAQLTYLGADEHGCWLGDVVGNPWSRPGGAFTSLTHNVLLVPPDRGFLAMSFEPHADLRFRLYVDITTVPVWEGSAVMAVDLDLDVIQTWDGELFVDDEDEFVEHQVTFGYPAQVVRDARAECDRVVAEVRSGAAWSQRIVANRWRAVLADLVHP